MAKTIPIWRGRGIVANATVSDCDYVKLKNMPVGGTWRLKIRERKDGSSIKYAVFAYRDSGRHVNCYMHVVILQWKLKRELLDFRETDHQDGDGLNNIRKNLREATHSQNQANRRLQSGKYKGVQASGSKFTSSFRKTYLGTFNSDVDAARRYDREALRVMGAFARLNFPGAAND
jgi:hypothetical protein